jgi:acyl-CoA hydrolase
VTGANVSNESLTLADLAGVVVNGSVSLSNISNGRCSQLDFGIGGIAVGDSAIVTPSAATQNGIVLYADRVTSAGHLLVNVCNFTGGAMSPITNLPVRIISFR